MQQDFQDSSPRVSKTIYKVKGKEKLVRFSLLICFLTFINPGVQAALPDISCVNNNTGYTVGTLYSYPICANGYCHPDPQDNSSWVNQCDTNVTACGGNCRACLPHYWGTGDTCPPFAPNLSKKKKRSRVWESE